MCLRVLSIIPRSRRRKKKKTLLPNFTEQTEEKIRNDNSYEARFAYFQINREFRTCEIIHVTISSYTVRHFFRDAFTPLCTPLGIRSSLQQHSDFSIVRFWRASLKVGIRITWDRHCRGIRGKGLFLDFSNVPTSAAALTHIAQKCVSRREFTASAKASMRCPWAKF